MATLAKSKAAIMDIVQLTPDQAAHTKFKFGQVTQVNDDGSVFVTGQLHDGGEWFIPSEGISAVYERKTV